METRTQTFTLHRIGNDELSFEIMKRVLHALKLVQGIPVSTDFEETQEEALTELKTVLARMIEFGIDLPQNAKGELAKNANVEDLLEDISIKVRYTQKNHNNGKDNHDQG